MKREPETKSEPPASDGGLRAYVLIQTLPGRLEGVARARADVAMLGHRVRIWSRGTTTYVLISHADARNVDAGTAYVMREAR